MFKVRVIPCLDVKDGRVVKGVNFINLRDAGDPVEAAIAYDAAGADELTFLDITASHEDRATILDVVQRTAEACFMPLTVGGGVRTVNDIRALLRAGADKVSINTAAVARRAFVKEAAEKFGDQCIVVAIDAKKVSGPGEPNRWEIFTHGGRKPTGLEAIAYAREVVALGAGEILLTSMDRDGTRQGFDIALFHNENRGRGSRSGFRRRDLADGARHAHELARHHDDGHGILLGADLGDHLHAPQLESSRILHDDLGCAAQLLGGLELGLRLDQARALLTQRFRLLRHGALHRFGNLDILHFHALDLDAPGLGDGVDLALNDA